MLAGDLELSLFEDKLSSSWGNCLNRDEAAFELFLLLQSNKEANERFNADFNIIDIGPNFGAINRATLIAADYVVVPMAVIYLLQGLKNPGQQIGVIGILNGQTEQIVILSHLYIYQMEIWKVMW